MLRFKTLILCGLLFAAVTQTAAASTSALTPDPELRTLLQKAIAETSAFKDQWEAEVWFADMNQRLTKRIPDPAERLELLALIHTEARRVNLQPELVMSVIEIESAFDRWAISSVGAQGLMQVMPFWLKEIGRPEDNLFNIKTNLRMGCTILRHYLDKENGNLVRALGRYNGSLGSYRYPGKVMAAMREKWYRP